MIRLLNRFAATLPVPAAIQQVTAATTSVAAAPPADLQQLTNQLLLQGMLDLQRKLDSLKKDGDSDPSSYNTKSAMEAFQLQISQTNMGTSTAAGTYGINMSALTRVELFLRR